MRGEKKTVGRCDQSLSPGLMANDIKVTPDHCIAATAGILDIFENGPCWDNKVLTRPTKKRDVFGMFDMLRTKMMIVSPVSLVCGQLAGEG